MVLLLSVNGAWSLMEGLGPSSKSPSPPPTSSSPPNIPTPPPNLTSKPRDSYQQYVAQLRTFSENLSQLEGRRNAHASWRSRRTPVTAWPEDEQQQIQTSAANNNSSLHKNQQQQQKELEKHKKQEEEIVVVTAPCSSDKTTTTLVSDRRLSEVNMSTSEVCYRTEILRVIEGRFVSQFHTQLGQEEDEEDPPPSDRFMRRLESADEGCCDTLALPEGRGRRGPSPASSSISSARSSSPGESEDEDETLGPCQTWRHPGWRTQRCASSDSAVVLDYRSHTWGDDEELLDEEEAEGAARAWRTPSVVVSDFSDETPPVWLDLSCLDEEDNERCRRLSDCSSCSGGLCAPGPQRKVSDCSTCSTLSGDEDPSASELRPIRQQPATKPSGWRKLRNIVQWTPFFQTYKKKRYLWIQLAGHQGNFKAGPEQGTILKKLCPKEELCFQALMRDVLRPYVPEYKGHITGDDADQYLQLQDLLGDFTAPCVMDCKVGVRTYLEDELAKAKEKPKLRKDMYEKMIQIDPNAPTEEEHRLKGVTKPRYMVWRETISSTATLGFRIEGIRKADGRSSKDFKTTKSRDQVAEAFRDFTSGYPHAIPKYIQRLKAIRATLEVSEFFISHEVIGSSLLFVHDSTNANVWLIDFAKTLKLPPGTNIDHSSRWVVGNHEDGYMIGIDNLLSIFEEMYEVSESLPPAPSETSDVTEEENSS